MHKTKLITPPQEEPLTLEEVKEHLKIGDSEDTYIESLIKTARISLERYLNRALITQSHRVYYDCWHYKMRIPFPPLQSVDGVFYYGQDETLTELPEEDFYWIVDTTDPSAIVRKFDVVYPELQDGRPDAIYIEFTCGYGEREEVPEDLKAAMKLMITDYYEHRGSIVIGQVNKIPDHITGLTHSYKIYLF